LERGIGLLNFLVNIKSISPPPMICQAGGSGTVTTVKPQLTKVLWSPSDRSAMNSVQFPSAKVPANEPSVATLVDAPSNTLPADCGSMFRASGAHVPVSCPVTGSRL
jgi:hypothetical protein